jgi:beta-lactamase regulating signal transducer with metallopeptidase domain
MEILHDIFQAAIVQRIGWTLVHFVWQAAAIAIALAIMLKLLQKSSANLRYAVGCMAMLLIVIMPAVTIRLIDVPVPGFDPIKLKQAGVDLSQVGANTLAVIEMPQVELPPVEFTAIQKLPLKDRFINAVEPGLPYMVIGWLAGVFGLSLWHLGGWGQLQKLRRQMVKQVAPSLNAKLQQLSNALGIQKVVGIVESALVGVPTVVGHLKPVILLPSSALTGLSGEQIEAILAHELAHIKRCDYLVNMGQTVVEILGFYHPAVWWVSDRIRVERENCCDDIAVSVCTDRVCYAKALATMEEIRGSGAGLAMAASGGNLLMRIRRLVSKDSGNEGKLSWLPSAIAMVLISSLLIPVCFAMGNSKPQNADLPVDVENDMVRVYHVNRNVSDFPEAEDFSVPESAYAAINRVMAAEDNQGWQRVSVKRLTKRLAKDAQVRNKKKTDSEWANVVLNARILEVRIKDGQAVVIARFPQAPEGKPIREPFDYRHLELENGKWLNAGENRYDNIEQAREKFAQMVEKQSTEAIEQLKIEQKYTEVLDKPEILLDLTEGVFEKIRKANYDKILSYYDEQTGKWKRDGWKKLGLDYMVHTDWPSFAVWVCSTFKDNPIESVELGDVFISDKEVLKGIKAPAVPYRLVLQDEGILEGDLYFVYWDKSGNWQAAEGLDWHLQDEPIKRPAVPAEVEKEDVRQIMTTGYILSVPVDLPQLKEIISDDNSKTKMITAEKLEEFLKVVNTTAGAKRISTPAILLNDGESGEIRTKNDDGFESIKFNVKNTIENDGKLIMLEVYFTYSHEISEKQEYSVVSDTVTTTAAVPSGRAIAMACNEVENGQRMILLVKPEIVEGQSQKTGVVEAEKPAGREKSVFDSLFEIPAKIGLAGRMLSVNEKNLIKGLAFCSEISGGRYPASMDTEEVIGEIKDWLADKEQRGEIDYANMNKAEKQKLREQILDAFFMTAFYKTLEGENASYYGSSVTSNNTDLILLRWKVSGDEYRVIYGDLRKDTIKVISWDEARAEALSIIQSRTNWPETPKAVAQVFWDERAKKNYDEMKNLWPGSASWVPDWNEICEDDPNVKYVFGQASNDRTKVPYASKEHFEETGSYNLTMYMAGMDTKKGRRYYILSGN